MSIDRTMTGQSFATDTGLVWISDRVLAEMSVICWLTNTPHPFGNVALAWAMRSTR